jgi:hypothetical protein
MGPSGFDDLDQQVGQILYPNAVENAIRQLEGTQEGWPWGTSAQMFR